MKSTARLWYTSPAQKWVEALPLGNGRIGAMVFGGVQEEKLALNEDTLWSGHPRQYRRENAPEAIRDAQALIRNGKLAEAQKLIEQKVTSEFSQAYMPLGDMVLRFIGLGGEPQDYVRELNIETGMHSVRFSLHGVQYLRETFISYPDQALVMRLSADQGRCISFDMALDTQLKKLEEGVKEVSDVKSTMLLRAVCPSQADPHYVDAGTPIVYEDDPRLSGVRFCAIADICISGGETGWIDGGVAVRGADSAEIRFVVRTSFNGFDKFPGVDGKNAEADAHADLAALSAHSYAYLKARHETDFASCMNRCDFHLDAPKQEMSTLERLRAFRENQHDPALYELLFQYGRYLTVAASRPGTQATNLQGIWNDSMLPPWSSNYTVNINTEMNYWPTEPTNLSDMTAPLFDLIHGMHENGKITARDYYGARGSAAHHNTDLWCHTTPVGNGREGSMVWSFWPNSLGWMCRHLFDHYLFTGDETFLREQALPVIRDATLFYCDAMVDDGNSHLSIYPATSPENVFIYEGTPVSGAANATMQEAIVKEVFLSFLECLEILGMEDELAATVREKLDKIRPYTIGSQGQLLEWTKEYEEREPHHRHQSHLYPLYPGMQITEATPELMDACKRSLELRGDEGTGWSLGWKINLWARLNDGDHAMQLIKMQLRLVDDSEFNYTNGGGTYPNMFDAHPPFQIDGNYGATAGICEMLMRTRPEELILLPALPGEWPDGKITGLRAMGGLTVDIRFAGGKLAEAHICADITPRKPVRVVYAGRTLAMIEGPCDIVLKP